MDFEEYIMAINCTNFSEPKDKLTWIFNVFDEVKFDFKLHTVRVHFIIAFVRMAADQLILMKS